MKSVALIFAVVAMYFVTPQQSSGAPIVDIVIDGAKKTDVGFVRKILVTKIGDEYDANSILYDIQALSSLELYQYVRAATETVAGGVAVSFAIKERITISPIIRPFVGGGTYYFALGMRNGNIAGRLAEVAGYGGVRVANGKVVPLYGGWYIAPFLLGTQIRTEVEFVADVIFDSAYLWRGNKAELTTERKIWTGGINLGKQLKPGYFLFGTLTGRIENGAVFDESQINLTTVRFLEPQANSLRIGTTFRIRRTTYDEPNWDGWKYDLRLLSVTDNWGDINFEATTQYARYWDLANGWINPAVNAELEYTSSDRWSNLRRSGGLTGHIRGFPNRFFHSQGIASLNLELRSTILRWKVLGIQPKVFVDFAGFHAYQDAEKTRDWHAAASAGGGIFFWLPWIQRTRLRVDAGFPLTRPLINNFPEISISAMQYF